MSELNKIMTLRGGLHTNNTTFALTDVPGTFPFSEPETAEVLPRDTVRIDRDLYREDNKDYASIVGPKSLDELAIGWLLRGVSGNAGGVVARLTDTELGVVFDSVMGTGVDKAEAATAITGDTGGSGIITVTSGTGHVDGGGVLFMDGSGNYVAREIVSGGGTGTLTLDRDHTDGAPGSDNIPYGSVHWTIDPSTSMHVPMYFRAEGANWCRDYAGCFGDLTIEIDDKGVVRVQSRWMPTDWRDTAEPNTAFSAPTAGDYVMGMNSRLWIGDDAYMMKGGALRLGYTIQARDTSHGANGLHGYIVKRKSPVFETSIYHGTNGASFGEVPDSVAASAALALTKINAIVAKSDGTTAHGAGKVAETHDVGIQIGGKPKGTMYVRMPAGELSGRMTNDNGVEMVSLTVKARRPSSGSECRIHCF